MDVALDPGFEIRGMSRSMLLDTPDQFLETYGESNHSDLLLSIHLRDYLDVSFFEFFSVVENGENDE